MRDAPSNEHSDRFITFFFTIKVGCCLNSNKSNLLLSFLLPSLKDLLTLSNMHVFNIIHKFCYKLFSSSRWSKKQSIDRLFTFFLTFVISFLNNDIPADLEISLLLSLFIWRLIHIFINFLISFIRNDRLEDMKTLLLFSLFIWCLIETQKILMHASLYCF